MKNRASVVGSILKDPKLLEDVYNSSKNDSEGAAQNELNAYLESVDAKIQKITNDVQNLTTSALSGDTVKGFLDVGDGILKFLNSTIDHIGALNTLLIATAGIVTPILSSKKSGGLIRLKLSTRLLSDATVGFSGDVYEFV